MRRLSVVISAFAVAVWSVACSNSQPLSPSAALSGGTGASIDAFTGSWGASSTSSAALPNGCTKFDYQVDRLSDSSAKVTVDANCASVAVTGSGQGTLSNNVLAWSASGNATAKGMTCPFNFTDSTATPEGGGVRVVYSGTVCGVPVRGSELLMKK